VTVATVDRLHVACAAPSSRERDALAMRQRLVTTGRTHLPQALAHALPDDHELRMFVERIEVELDFDASDYDDVTLATLWAARIARALEELEASRQGVHVFRSTRAFVAGALDELLDRGSLSWVYAELGGGTLTPAAFLAQLETVQLVRPLLEALAVDGVLATRLYDRLTPSVRRSFVAALRGEERWGSWTDGSLDGTAVQRHVEGARPDANDGSVARTSAADAADPATPSVADADDVRTRPDDAQRVAPPTLSEWLGAIRAAAADGAHAVRFGAASTAAAPKRSSTSRAESRSDADTTASEARSAGPRTPLERTPRERPANGRIDDVDTEAADEQVARVAWWSTAGGLVLLYPWLERYLGGELPVPAPLHGLDAAIAARMWALASLACDDPEPLVGDPVVRLLAGAEPTDGPTPVLRAEPSEALDDARTRVLSDFATVLPGLAGSSPDYLRSWFVQRDALVEPVSDGVIRVRLERGPLDVLLERLPYPLGAFRLPWTQLLLIDRRSDDA
jgi:hypothetical protein